MDVVKERRYFGDVSQHKAQLVAKASPNMQILILKTHIAM